MNTLHIHAGFINVMHVPDLAQLQVAQKVRYDVAGAWYLYQVTLTIILYIYYTLYMCIHVVV